MPSNFNDGARRVLLEIETHDKIREEYRQRFRWFFLIVFCLIFFELIVIAFLAYKLFTRGCV